MHEFSISSEIVKTVLESTQKNNGKKVLSVQLEIGEFMHLNREQVAFWVRELFKETAAEGAEVRVKEIRGRVRCEDCGYQERTKHDHQDPFLYLVSWVCPQCHSSRLKIEKGQECILKKIRLEK